MNEHHEMKENGNSAEEGADRTRRWSNPYIARLGSVPGYLLGTDSPKLSDEELHELQRRIAEFPALEVEIGSGSGEHLIELAKRSPQALVVGIEIRFKRSVRTAEKASREGLRNLLVLRADATNLESMFSERSVDALYVNFPDPWGKRRWHKHRTLEQRGLQSFWRVLKAGGLFCFKTDHREYFDETATILQASAAWRLHEVCLDVHHSDLVKQNIPTEFERLFVSQGLAIHWLKAEAQAGAPT